jgi:hypothetical protein
MKLYSRSATGFERLPCNWGREKKYFFANDFVKDFAENAHKQKTRISFYEFDLVHV